VVTPAVATEAAHPQRVKALLTAMETRAHRAGWDKPPALYVLYDNHHLATVREYRTWLGARYGTPVVVGRYGAQPMAPYLFTDGTDPAVTLTLLAMNLSDTVPGRTLAGAFKLMTMVLRQPGFLGTAFQAEGYGMVMDTEQAEVYLRDETRPRLGDTVGAQEYRCIDAADVAGYDYAVQRWSGAPPQVHHLDPANPPTDPDKTGKVLLAVEGSVQTALRRITAVVAGLPHGPLTMPRRWPWPADGAGGADHQVGYLTDDGGHP
jgi:hypothetical protein